LVYPPEYQAWLAERFRAGRAGETANGYDQYGALPEAAGNAPRLGRPHIRLPAPGSVFYIDPALPAEAQALRIETSGFDIGAFVYVDETLQGSLNSAGVFALTLSRGAHRVMVEDESGGRAFVAFEVR
jgi:penicillin-binding protein 1C